MRFASLAACWQRLSRLRNGGGFSSHSSPTSEPKLQRELNDARRVQGRAHLPAGRAVDRCRRSCERRVVHNVEELGTELEQLGFSQSESLHHGEIQLV